MVLEIHILPMHIFQRILQPSDDNNGDRIQTVVFEWTADGGATQFIGTLPSDENAEIDYI